MPLYWINRKEVLTLVKILTAGTREFTDAMRREVQDYPDLRIVSATTEPSTVISVVEEKTDIIDAVLLGLDEQKIMTIIDMIERYALSIVVFVVEENPVKNHRKWMKHRVKMARVGKELESIAQYFAARPQAVKEYENPTRNMPLVGGSEEQELKEAAVQEVKTRERASRAVTVKQRVITVYGNKGGVGKTALSIAMAQSIVHLTGLSVAIVDLDMSRSYGNCLSYFGFIGDEKKEMIQFSKSEKKEYAQIIAEKTMSAWARFPMERRGDRRYVNSCLVKVRNNLFVLPPIRSMEDGVQVDHKLVKDVIGVLQKHFDVIVVDAGNNLTNAAVGAIEVCDDLLLTFAAEMATIDSLIDFLTDTFNKIQSNPVITLIINKMFPEFPCSSNDIQEFTKGLLIKELPEDDKTDKMIRCKSTVPCCGIHEFAFARGVENLLVDLFGGDVIRSVQEKPARGFFSFFKRKKKHA